MAGNERVIVLVDDMEQMTAIGADFLQRRLDGVRVVAFNKPREALAWMQSAPRVDMVLSDNHMGDMDGLSLLEQSRAAHPTAARVLMTAYLDIIATPPQLGARGVHALIRKPFEWNDFGLAIFEILAMGADSRARAEREGPLAYPEGAFAEFAASRASRALPPLPPPSPDAPRVAKVDVQPAAPRPVATRPMSPPPPLPPVLRLAATPGRAKVGCPHCHGDIQIELLIPSARPGGSAPTDDAEAKRLLAYLQARPGVAARLRQMAQSTQRK